MMDSFAPNNGKFHAVNNSFRIVLDNGLALSVIFYPGTFSQPCDKDVDQTEDVRFAFEIHERQYLEAKWARTAEIAVMFPNGYFATRWVIGANRPVREASEAIDMFASEEDIMKWCSTNDFIFMMNKANSFTKESVDAELRRILENEQYIRHSEGFRTEPH